MNYEHRTDRGAALLISVLFLLMLIGLATAAAVHSQTSQLTSRAQLLDKQAFYIAEAGIQRGRLGLETDTWSLGATNAESFGTGEYSVATAGNGSCTPVSTTCEVTITSSAYIPTATSYSARRQIIEDDIPATVLNTNLSLSATASASTETGAHRASDANDNDMATYWEPSSIGSGEWLRMDHGSATTVDQIIVLENDHIDGLSAVEYSDNGSTWTSVSGLSVAESPSQTWTVSFTAASHRYFRVTFTASASNHKVSVKEQQHYSTASQTVSLAATGDYSTSW